MDEEDSEISNCPEGETKSAKVAGGPGEDAADRVEAA